MFRYNYEYNSKERDLGRTSGKSHGLHFKLANELNLAQLEQTTHFIQGAKTHVLQLVGRDMELLASATPA